MNVLELYRLLPRTNCGLCPARRCMAFAVSLAKGEAAPEQCPSLSEKAREQLRAGGGRGDWREGLIADLRKQVAGLDFEHVAPGLGAGLREGALVIPCLGRELLVQSDGTICAEGPIDPWTKILLLHYVRTGGAARVSGAWVAFSELKSGLVKATSFARECEEPLRELFVRDLATTQRALARLGAKREPGTPAPVAWRLDALPRVPVLVLFWPQDEEFPAKLKVLFDASADRYLDVEALTFLIEGLSRSIEGGPGSALHD